MTSGLRRVGSGLLTIGAALGVCCLVLVAIGPIMDVRPLLFRSGSMAPTIESGDLAIARAVPARDLGVGDIVSVPSGGGDRVTHRIIDIEHYDGGASLTLRGDGNQSADPEPYDVSRADRVMFVVPWAGRVVSAVIGPLGMLLMGLAAAGLLALVIRGGPGDRDDGGSGRGRPGGRRRASRLAVASGAGMAVLVAGPASAAPWTDDAAVTGTTLTATTIPTTTLTCQNLNLLSLRFSWTAVADATSYRLFYNSGSNSLDTTNTTATVGSLINGGTAWVVVRRNFGSTTWSSASSNTVRYTVLLVATCN